ncbi:ECF transporter S component [Lederbergia sp. NSJ-179]|uniref:ECF transporter S component n=1 Tax=Lederbergia sp. NSJ-179 TaxID=2931402 RepID=UPI0024586AFE|nr:ECF transporter S component [Lederbergia sp. NSJ-179]
MKNLSVRSFVIIGMLSSLAFIFMLIKFPIPPFPPYLTVDFSDIPALIAALILGPTAGILVELFKNILDYLTSGSPTGIPIGNMSNFIAGVLFILPTYIVYKQLKAKWGLMVSLTIGTLFMAVFMSILNYIAILPAYIAFGGWEPMSTVALRKIVVLSVLPFNIIKGLIVAAVFLLVYKRLSNWLNKQAAYKKA